MSKNARDGLWSVICLALSLWIYYYSDTFRSSARVPLLADATLYTRLWAVVLFLLSLGLLIRSIRAQTKGTGPALCTLGTFCTIVLLLMYVLLLKSVGFFLCTLVFLTVLVTYYHYLSLDSGTSPRPKLAALTARYFVLALVVTFVLDFAFSKLLSVYLPTFSLFG
ncbi:MAG: tripartite tricarboxylate transporter TctB family protein [Synergistaceae bacterium]|jgi:hypothetical protein|nr:tripartite tricarboxylate transporter TctB family protein [Synergistaceae bacterium]